MEHEENKTTTKEKSPLAQLLDRLESLRQEVDSHLEHNRALRRQTHQQRPERRVSYGTFMNRRLTDRRQRVRD